MLAVKLFLALILGSAALHKGMERDRLAGVTARLARIGVQEGRFLLLTAALVEGLAALALLVPGLAQGGAIAATLLWSLYAIALWRQRGQRMDCGCDFTRREKPIGTAQIARPALLAALALAVALLPEGSWSAEAPFAALGFAALWFAAGELLSLPHFARAR